MSAYIVDKDHILFLVTAAQGLAHGSAFRWYWDGRSAELHRSDYCRAAEVANMLWCENIKSVSHRYPHESSATLPGPICDEYVITPKDFEGNFWRSISPVQVLKACDCYDYQSCEHTGWESSEAHTFIDTLRGTAWRSLPGYDEAEWGAPKLGVKVSL